MTGKAQRSVYSGRDPREIAAYPLFEAARYLRVPSTTLRSWTRGTRPLIDLDDPDGRLSFYNIVEAFVVAGLRRHHNVSAQRLREDVDYLRQLAPRTRHPLADLDLSTFAKQVYLEDGRDLLNVSRRGQLGISDVLRGVLSRVEKDPSAGALRLYPLTRNDIAKSPKLISIDPRVAFGRPVIAGTGIPTAVLHDRWKAGDSVATLAEDYDRKPEEIEEALRYEAA